MRVRSRSSLLPYDPARTHPSIDSGTGSSHQDASVATDRVVAAARSWLGTPYHDQASLKGVGCDCLGLVRGVWREVVGPEPLPIPSYRRDWGETGAHEPLAEAARAVMLEIPVADLAPSVLILFRMRHRRRRQALRHPLRHRALHPRLRAHRRDRGAADADLAPAHRLRVPVSADEGPDRRTRELARSAVRSTFSTDPQPAISPSKPDCLDRSRLAAPQGATSPSS